ncbi:MAG: glycosyltransferase [Vicinamibacterales bacterium]
MRVLALAALDIPYIRDNWLDALKHVMGDDVTTVNVSAWLACAPKEAHMKAIYRLIATGSYDCLFLYHDYIFADFPDEFFAHVRSAGLRTVAYHPDDEPEVWYRRNAPFDHRYDVVASHAQRGVFRRTQEGRPTRAVYVPWGFNPRFFDRPSQPVTPVHDVVFIGKYKVHEHDTTLFREDGERRDASLRAVAKLCDRHGWRFSIFGHGWERHRDLARYAGGVLSHEDMIRTFHQSRIVINPGWTADEGEAAPQTKLRHFEVPGCGAFQLTNTTPELAELFEPGSEIAFYDDNEQLCERVEYYLSHDAERRAIADRGYARVHRDHTLDRRVEDLLGHIARLAPPRPRVARTHRVPAVKTVQVRNREELASLRTQIAAGVFDVAGADAVHLLACDGSQVTTQYAPLQDWWHAEASVFSARVFYKSPKRGRNPLQPQRSELIGGFLSANTALKAMPKSHRMPVLSACVSVSDEEHARFLASYVVRPDALLALIDAFLSGNAEAVDALQPIETGLVLAEVTVDLTAGGEQEDNDTATPVYLEPLRRVLRQAAILHQRVGIYGARGEMAEAVFDEVRRHKDVELVAIFDRAMAGRTLSGVPVLSAFDIPQVKPDLVFIAAAYSGAAIYEQLKPLEAQITLVPVYDLDAPAWSVLIAA